jgi:hypothetical protein
MASVGEFARANGVALHPEMDGVIVGPPAVLEAICKAFGFRNRCPDGKVYLTPRKIRELGVLPVAKNAAARVRLAPLAPTCPVQSVSASINAIVAGNMPTLSELDDEPTVVERLAKGGSL